MKTLLKRFTVGVAVASLLMGAPAPGELADGRNWPDRWSAGEEAALKGAIVELDVQGLQPQRTSLGVRRPSAHDLKAVEALLGEKDNPNFDIRFEGPGAFLYAPAGTQRQRGAGRPEFYFKFVSGRKQENGGDKPLLEITRTWFAWYDAAAGVGERGTILLMPGMLGTPEATIEYLITHLRDEGYGVLRMMCQPSRFTERIIFDVDLDDPEPAARRIAREAAQRLAECAYAVEAAFAYIAQRRPDYAQLPRIAMGMSGGAMILPTVVAREADQYAAAILIAGGANMMAILHDSNYRHMINAAHINWSELPGEDLRSRFDELYLSLATLDPFHTAEYLRELPVLMLHATHDLAVPAVLGELLWERLGRPERWVEEAGHEELFMRLPQRAGDIIEWLGSQIASEDD